MEELINEAWEVFRLADLCIESIKKFLAIESQFDFGSYTREKPGNCIVGDYCVRYENNAIIHTYPGPLTAMRVPVIRGACDSTYVLKQ